MANTYPSLSVKGMIYIHSGSPQICVSSQKTAQGRRGRSEDPVYTACGPKICMGTVVCDVFKSQMHNFDGPPTTLQTEHRTRLQAWFNTYDVGFPTSRRRGEGGRRRALTRSAGALQGRRRRKIVARVSPQRSREIRCN